MVQMDIKRGTRYNLRASNEEDRDAPSFDRDYMDLGSSYSGETFSSAEVSNDDTKSRRADDSKDDQLRLLAEAVQKLKARNDQLLKEKAELLKETEELRSQVDKGSSVDSSERAQTSGEIPEGDGVKSNSCDSGTDEEKDELPSDESSEEKTDDSEEAQKLSETVLANCSSDGKRPSTIVSDTSGSRDLSQSNLSQSNLSQSHLSQSHLSQSISSSESSEYLAVSASLSTVVDSNEEVSMEVLKLHQTIEENNAAITDLNDRINELLHLDEENQRSIGLLHAKIEEQKDTMERMNENKQDVLDQLESKRLQMLELEKKLKGTYENHGDYIRKIKDLEISVADRTFLAAELRRELTDAQEEKIKFIQNREQDVLAMVKKRMVAVEKRLYREAEERMREVQRREMDLMAEELATLEAKTRTMRMQLSDGTFERKYHPEEVQTVPLTSGGSCDSNDEQIDPWFNKFREENKTIPPVSSSSSSLTPSLTVPAVPELLSNLNELKSALAFTEKINRMTVSAIKEKVAVASGKVEKLKDSYEHPRPRGHAAKTITCTRSTASEPANAVFTSLSQEWETYYEEKKHEQEAAKTIFEREATHFANAIRKNTFLFGGFMD